MRVHPAHWFALRYMHCCRLMRAHQGYYKDVVDWRYILKVEIHVVAGMTMLAREAWAARPAGEPARCYKDRMCPA